VRSPKVRLKKELTSIQKLIVMKKIVITKQEVWQATRPSIQKNKKKYSRKNKDCKQNTITQ
jgi:hypothetical protein